MHRRFFLALPGLAACRRQPPSRLKVAVVPYFALAGFHLARERGFFQRAGFEFDLVPVPRSQEAIPLLAKGELDVGFYTAGPAVLNAIAKGVPVRLVAARDAMHPDCGEASSLIARRSSLREPGLLGLKGKHIALQSKASLTEFALDQALRQAGVPWDSVQRSVMKMLDGAAALKAGRVDALIGPDAASVPALQSEEFVLLTKLGRILPGFQSGFVIFGKRLLEAPVEEGVRFLQAFSQGQRAFAQGESPAWIEEYAKNSGLDAGVLRAQCRSHVLVDGVIRHEDLRKMNAWSVEKGYSDALTPPARYVDERFALARRKENS
jgi:NitT/TauT family transport system substrate-binding protein